MLLTTKSGPATRLLVAAVGVLLSIVWVSCSGDDGAPGQDGENAVPPLTPADPLPGVVIGLQGVTGGTGPGGNLRAGDVPRVTFSVNEESPNDGEVGPAIPAENWSFQELLFAGPSTNYQLIFDFGDIAANSVQNADGTWTFTFPEPIPAQVPDQINQEGTVDEIYDSGTIAGQDLPSGTYTVGLSIRQEVEIAGDSFRDASSATIDVLFGDATTISKPELVTDANCVNCHTVLRAHGDNRYGVALCVLCHTNGSEDLNDPNAVAGETLGLSISFQTMIHKVHSGAHLPSVNGKTVDSNGDPVYMPGQGTPYVIVRSRGEFDFSHVAFPQWPNLDQGMPQDTGYDALMGDEQDIEDAILSGPTNCAACHGDPDGAGPLPPPADGDAIFTNAITTRACIACHDDWDPSLPYTANGFTMPAGLDDSTCTSCHGENPSNPSPNTVDVRKAHTHPLLDANDPPLWGPGAGAIDLQFNITEILGVTDGVGNTVLDAGDNVQVTLDVVDGDGAAVDPAAIARMEMVMNGPVENANLLYVTAFSGGNPPSQLLTGPGPSHTFLLPEHIRFEFAAQDPVNTTEYLTSSGAHRDILGGTDVYVAAPGATSTTLAVDSSPYQNYIDVDDASALVFDGSSATPEIVAVDDGTADVEYLEVVSIDGNRIWFRAPVDTVGIRLTKAHLTGATVTALDAVPDPNATLVNAAEGRVDTQVAGAGDVVLVSFTTDYVVPDVYRGAINNSPSQDPSAKRMDETIGEWTGFALVDGTYHLGIYGETTFDVTVTGGGQTQVTGYQEGSTGNTVQAFRMGTDGPLDTHDIISSGDNCLACHRDLQFHGSHRRGYDNCLLCHVSSGSEDWPAHKPFFGNPTSGPESPGLAIEFREMIHKIHHGHSLDAGADYVIAGFRGSAHTYEHVGFPSFRGQTANCESCHGEGNTAWHEPTLRLHPDQGRLDPQLTWRMVCGSCHDDRTALSHMIANSGAGVEGCALCHGDGKLQGVEVMHRNQSR